MVKAIEQLSDDKIEHAIQQAGYNFYFPDSNDRMTAEFVEELCHRKNLLAETINAYCERLKIGKFFSSKV